MTGIGLALLLLVADPPWVERRQSDARALEAVKASEIVEPVASCLRKRIAAHSVTPGQAGSEAAAQHFATWLMTQCGADEAGVRLIEAMRVADPGLASEDAERRVGAMMGSVLSTAAIQAYKHFRVAPVRIQLVDCTRKTPPRPDECKEPPAPRVEPIDLPYQATEAFSTYRRCVLGRFDVAIRSVRNLEEARQAHFDSVAACRDVRAIQLARALDEVTDREVYGSREKALAAARLAFDRFDREFDMEWDSPAPPPPIKGAGPDGRSQ